MSAAPISEPISIRPVVSIVTWTISGDLDPGARHGAPGRDDRRLALEQVLHRLDEEGVDPTGEEPLDLWNVGVAEVGEADVAERRELRARSHRPDHETGLVGRREPARHLLRDLGRDAVHLERLLGDVVLGEHHGERSEGRRLDRVDPRLEELGVEVGDQVGSREDEVLVATLECRTAEVVGPEVVLLDPRPEGPVEDEDTFSELGEEVRHELTRLPER